MIKKKYGEEEYEFSTVQELIEFEKAMKQETKTVVVKQETQQTAQPTIQQKHHKRKQTDTSLIYDQKITQAYELRNAGISLKEAFVRVFGRATQGQDYRRFKEMYGVAAIQTFRESWLKSKNVSEPVPEKPKQEPNYNKSKSRMLEIHAKIRADRAADPTLSFPDAMRRYIPEYRSPYEGKKAEQKVVDKQDTIAEEQRKFIEARARKLCEQDNRLTYEQARDRARLEANYGKLGKVEPNITPKTADLEFPVIKIIDDMSQQVLQSMMKNIIGVQGRLTYHEVCNALMVEPMSNNGMWSGKVWHYFVAEVLQKSGQIADYFGVKNKFKHVTIGGFEAIQYGDQNGSNN